MNRRGFFGRLAALIAVPFVRPKVDDYGPIRLSEQFSVPFTWNPPSGWPTVYVPPLRVGEIIRVKLPERFKATDSLQPHLHEAVMEFDAK